MIRVILCRNRLIQYFGRAARRVIVTCAVITGPVLAQDVEIKPFAFVDTGGSFSARYVTQSQENKSQSATLFWQDLSAVEQEIAVEGIAYVYHPAFLNMRLGTGLINTDRNYENAFLPGKDSDVLVNYNARLDFLNIKSWPFSIYIRRSHPSVMTNLSGRILTQNDQEGFDWRFSKLGKLGTLRLALNRYSNTGSGFGSIIDESGDEAMLIWRVPTPFVGPIEVEHRDTRRLSASGSLGLPIRNRDTELLRTSVGAVKEYGETNRLRATHRFVRFEQEVKGDELSDFSNHSYSLTLRDQWSEATVLNANYQFNSADRTSARTRSNRFGLGMSQFLTKRLQYLLNTGLNDVRQEGFSRETITAGGRVAYAIDSAIGRWNLGADYRLADTDQVSERDSIAIFDETLVLNGTDPVALANEFIDTDSIVVKNSTGSQIYVAGLDYRVIVIGTSTSIQRLISGNILDGETVLVDYQYATTGTAEYEQQQSNVFATLNLMQYASIRLQYGRSETDVTGGELIRPTNDRTTFEAVLDTRLPTMAGWTLGAELRHADRREEIFSSVRDSIQLTASRRIRGTMMMSVFAGLVEVDNKNSVEDINQFNTRLSLSGTVFNRVLVDYSFSFLSDDGGSLEREQQQHRLAVQWRYRSVSFVLRGLLSEDILGPNSRRYTSVNAEFRRNF